MSNPLQIIKDTSAQIVIDADLLHEIVHGTSTADDVTTEGGDVKTIAKVIAEGEAALATAIGDVGADILAAASAAAASATAAATSATNAATSASGASGSASTATTAATAAAASATAAATSATAAATSAGTASTASTAAITAATNAANSATAAATSAAAAATSATAAAASAAAAAASAAAASSGTSLGTTTQNAGNSTITPTNGNHTQVVTVTGIARDSILVLDPTGRNSGDRLVVVMMLSLTPDILFDFRNATTGGTALLPATFPAAKYNTDDTVTQASFEFFIQGGAWKYMRSQIPA